MKILCMIPARIGSQRLRKKNLKKIKNLTLVENNILKCKKIKQFEKIYLNSSSKLFKKFAIKNNINFYLRDKKLGSNKTTSEDYIYDFLKKNNCDYIVQVHSITPLLKLSTIKKFLVKLVKKKPKIMFSYDKITLETCYKNKPINFNKKKKINSQNLRYLQKINWAISAWHAQTFLRNKKNKKNATFGEKIYFFEISPYEGIAIKNAEDLKFVRKIIR